MKVKVYKDTPPEEETLFLQLKEHVDGTVALKAVDSKGRAIHCGNILFIRPDGTFSRAVCCNAPGIQTDSNGQIKEYHNAG